MGETKEKISVIVPIYNVESYVEECIKSICKQTYSAIEIILVDDGSTDNSGSICDEYAKIDTRIKVIHKKNDGLVKTRKVGLQQSKGNYILCVDGDDWIEPTMIERLYSILTEQKVDIVMCGRFEDTGDTHRPVFHGISEGRYNKQALLEKVYPNMIVNGAFFEWGLFPSVWDKLFRRECLEEYQMAVDDRLTMGEDAACTYPALLNVDSIYVLHECLYHYRQSTSSMVKQTTDVELQRKRFSILYSSVNKSFEKYKDIYDLREQWKEYLLFLMVPRADVLYKNIEKLDYLFPYKSVRRGSNIVLYGMGTYGQLLYKFIQSNNFCNILACADKNYLELSKQGLPVVPPDEIGKYDYDAIVVANSFAKVRNNIYKELSIMYSTEKIHLMDEDLIKSDESLWAFGLI
ncbi:MAG: glycosyltransferase family 2 protein [Lachnospiraceae bacterium]|nr:glycosyltransferase family 2 protein [Lachnospiraceae bacterium]